MHTWGPTPAGTCSQIRSPALEISSWASVQSSYERQSVADLSGEGSEAPGLWVVLTLLLPDLVAVLISSRHSTDVCPGKVHPCLKSASLPPQGPRSSHSSPWLALPAALAASVAVARRRWGLHPPDLPGFCSKPGLYLLLFERTS